MSQHLELMQEAIRLANECKPNSPRVPKVGAIIAVDGVVVGRACRGTGEEADDDHAEHKAILQVIDRARLPEAVLYTTLEPCTPDVRTQGEACCTELILQYRIKKVVVGILDPNQEVTGKGLWKLQDRNVDVELFPDALARQIRAGNADFIRCHQTLGAKIVSPQHRDVLETTKTHGRHAVRVRCLNPPNATNYLFTSSNGLYWPQPGPFRAIDSEHWEIDAFFGALGDHSLHIVTATEIGQVLIEYYRKVVRWNVERRERLKKYNPSQEDLARLLGGDYFGITMTGLQKGLRSEDSITVTIA
jgi:pyrimidine deaminase RibD-like protein